MNGAESLVHSLVAGGVETCFSNPGTSEIHIVSALDKIQRIRCILGLFEGVVTGAADGYARMTGRPACTLLHLGPGLANGLANLHNAYRARVPIINIVGQHATYHIRQDAPLTSDIEGIARQYSRWLKTATTSFDLGRDSAEAILRARTAPGMIATLIVPADVAWGEGGKISEISPVPTPPIAPNETIERAAVMLRSGLPTAIMLAGPALYGPGLHAAGRIAAATRSRLFSPYPFTRMKRGAGVPTVERTHYVLEQAVEQLKQFRQFILVGASSPVAYFAYPGKNSVLTPADSAIFTLTNANEDCVGTLQALAAVLSADQTPIQAEKEFRPPVPSGGITLPGLATAVGAVLPENAIVVDESMTSGRGLMTATRGIPAHEWLGNTGGSIGI